MTDFLNRVRNAATGGSANSAPDGEALREPLVPPLTIDPPAAPVAPHPPRTPAASPQDDLLGVGASVRRFAEFAAHGATQTPLTLGILGQAGAGKSFALNRLLRDVEGLASGASRQGSSPYVGQLVIARVDAAASGEPATRIAAALFDALHRPAPDGRTYPALAEEAAEAVTDPAEAARIARERLADTRRRLDTEREALREMNARRARVAESVLYETAGSRIDSHARVHRNAIESRLRGFGFYGSDPIATYKDLVRDISNTGGLSGRTRAFLRAVWGFRGQTRLIVLAILFFLLAFGIGEAQSRQDVWLGWLGKQESLKWLSSWASAHVGWLSLAKQAAVWAGVLALVFNLFRAMRFLSPIYRGVSLFRADLDMRNKDLDALIANQTQRVDDIAAEIDPLTKRTSEAERRAAAAASDAERQHSAKSPFGDGQVKQAAAFIKTLGDAAQSHDGRAPRRVLVAFDNLDALSANAATNFMAQAQELLAQPGFLTILTVGDKGPDGLSRFVDAPLRLAGAIDSQRMGNLVRAMLGRTVGQQQDLPLDASRSGFDAEISAAEAEMLESLAPIAAQSPRDARRFVTTYRLARQGFEHCGALAMAIAFQSGGHESEREALDRAMQESPDDAALSVSSPARVSFALEAARNAQRSPVTAGQLRAARAAAAQWSFA